MNEITNNLIKSIGEIKFKIHQNQSEINRLERLSSQKTDSFDKVADEVKNLESVERLIGQVEGLKEVIGILHKNFSIKSSPASQ